MIMYRSLSPAAAIIDAGLDLDNAALARATLPARMPPTVVCDLRQTRSIDLDGFSWLVELSDQRKRAGARLVMLGPPASLSGPLRAGELDQLFEWATDLFMALNHSGLDLNDTNLRLGR
jgi:hypothetical protein